MICKSCGSELVSESETCLFCNSKNEISTLPEEDFGLPSRPWNQSENVDSVAPSMDGVWSELRSKIVIDESHKERTWSEDFIPFKQYLRRRGRLIVEKSGPITDSKLEGVKMVVVGGPEKAWLIDRKEDRFQDDEIVRMRQYVDDGGCLLVMGDKLSNVERLSTLTHPFGISFSREPVGDITIHRAEMARHPVLDGVSALRLGNFHGSGGYYLEVIEPAFELAWVEGYPVMAACYFGQGMVIVISNLTLFSKEHLSQADNEVFLEKVVDEVMCENRTRKDQPVDENQAVESGVMVSLEPTDDNTFEEVDLAYPEEVEIEIDEENDVEGLIVVSDVEVDLDDENEDLGVAFDACESVWREILDSLIEVWQDWEDTFESFSADYEVVEEAEYPEDQELLMDVWERDVESWQPKFIELMERELSLWEDMFAKDEIDKVSRCLLKDCIVNRKTAIVQREQQIEVLTNQLEAMEIEDQFALEELFDDMTDVSYASALLRNDYVDLLQNLKGRGLPIPEEHIPEREEMQKEDWERGWSLIEWMQPIVIPENGKIRVAVSGEMIDEFESMLDKQQVESEDDDLSDQDSLDLKAA